MKATALCLLAVFLAGCGSSRETKEEEGDQTDRESMRKFESDFRPSDYDPEVSPTESVDPMRPREGGATEPTSVAASSAEQVPGFRVQLLSTTSIDEAKTRKQEAETLFPAESFYLQYDPPTYKIRAGNFLSRFEAERFARLLAEQGFAGAWAVPQKVFRQPPPR